MTQPAISFEFFPPKSLQASFRLWDCVAALAPFAPRFVSVTYGAGGSTRSLTHDAVKALQDARDLRVAAHLTCVDATREETLKIADDYAQSGVKDIVALRGDSPRDGGTFTPTKDGFNGSVALVEALSEKGDFNIIVGAYPERHPEARSVDADVDYLKAKVDAGATSAITQFFFEAETFFRFRDKCEKAGITIPIIPGILPVENWAGVKNFAAKCGAHIPPVLHDAFNNAARDGTTDLLATAVAAELCDTLCEGGATQLHFYTLNKPELTRDVCLALGLRPKSRLQNVA